MCGRFSLFHDMEQLQKQFDMIMVDPMKVRYNIAPTQLVVTVVLEEGKRVGRSMKWGLIPSWAKDMKIAYKLINARAETIDEKPMYKELVKKRRCIILADGFYEWKREGKEKRPYRFQLKSGKPFAFAGLWNQWMQNGETLDTCTIITTKPNELVKKVHDRMPVILPPNAYEIWLHHEMQDIEYLKNLLQPYPAVEMKAFEISTLVNSPKNDHPSILESLSCVEGLWDNIFE
ncbi:SOS response-associated peptidase [Thermoflavimicrobium daqui]|uniref:Abasic site processing protein n=1 Tax=Thermoflavimicrobium daqui TaxID=2137476 RepID=A0A364K6A0_9BACL|nr:SOS response-associated peptidase [Thermoflavimicrobium daqui]RAL25798.1 hypothetical protein DL897_06900 [Thermoflavimicrobium daqui]